MDTYYGNFTLSLTIDVHMRADDEYAAYIKMYELLLRGAGLILDDDQPFDGLKFYSIEYNGMS